MLAATYWYQERIYESFTILEAAAECMTDTTSMLTEPMLECLKKARCRPHSNAHFL